MKDTKINELESGSALAFNTSIEELDFYDLRTNKSFSSFPLFQRNNATFPFRRNNSTFPFRGSNSTFPLKKNNSTDSNKQSETESKAPCSCFRYNIK